MNIPAGLMFHEAYCLPPNCGTGALDSITHLQHHSRLDGVKYGLDELKAEADAIKDCIGESTFRSSR